MELHQPWPKTDQMIIIPKQAADCRINLETLKIHLSKMIDSPHRELISQVIIAHLVKTEVGINHLVLACAGIEPLFKYKVGTDILVNVDKLHSWKIDKGKTLAHTKTGPAYGYACGTITSVDPLSKYPYKCLMTAVVSGGGVTEEEMVFQEEDIHPQETVDDLIKVPEPPF